MLPEEVQALVPVRTGFGESRQLPLRTAGLATVSLLIAAFP
jgi:hypothetical protein